jgi:hypothetical protein
MREDGSGGRMKGARAMVKRRRGLRRSANCPLTQRDLQFISNSSSSQ